MRREVIALSGWALSPVHVGDGTELTPECFRLRGDRLERFDPPRALLRLKDGERRFYLEALRRGDLLGAGDHLARSVRDEDVIERIDITAGSKEDIGQAFRLSRRAGRVKPFVRSGGRPCLPGSSVKGALRTAWLAALAREHPAEIAEFRTGERLRKKVGKTGSESDRFQQALLGTLAHRTETDPLRDVSVGDAMIAEGGTLIDKASLVNCGAEGRLETDGPEGKVQMHLERLRCLFDGGGAPTIDLTLGLPASDGLTERQKRAGKRTNVLPERSPTLAELRRATNAHHAALWVEERSRFYAGRLGDHLDAAMHAFGLPTGAGELGQALDAQGLWLLRIGRHAHFEAKTVAGYRHGEQRGKDGNPARAIAHGGSRTVVRDDLGQLLPWGWVLLWPADKRPGEPPRLVPARTVASAPPPPRAAPARSAGMATAPGGVAWLFRKGDRVTNDGETATVLENVPANAKQMNVDFGDGSPEPVPVQGWSRA